jgi:hypothetical protein
MELLHTIPTLNENFTFQTPEKTVPYKEFRFEKEASSGYAIKFIRDRNHHLDTFALDETLYRYLCDWYHLGNYLIYESLLF